MTKTLSIGEVAERCGVTVKALRHFEALGLIAPGRSLADRRVFDHQDLARLQQVLALRKAGFKLSEIGAMIDRRALPPEQVFEAQIQALEARCAALRSAISLLEAGRRRLRDGETLDIDQFCQLIKIGEGFMQGEGWNAVFEKYYTPEDMQVWAEAKTKWAHMDGAEYGRQWQELIDRVEAEIAKATPTDSDVAMSLAEAWTALSRPMVDAVGVQVWSKAAQMYAEMKDWQTDQVKAPFSPEVWAFVNAALQAARAAGRLPPRATE